MHMEFDLLTFLYEIIFAKPLNKEYAFQIVGCLIVQPFAVMAFLNPIYAMQFKNIGEYISTSFGSLTTRSPRFNKTISLIILKTKLIFFSVASLLCMNAYVLTAFNIAYDGPKLYVVMEVLLKYQNHYVVNAMILLSTAATAFQANVCLSFIIYSAVHVICQVRLLRHYLAETMRNLEHSLDDEMYQKHIGEILKFTVMQHNNIAKFHKYYLRLMKLPILALTTLAAITLASCCYYLYADINPYYNVPMYGNIGIALILLSTYTHYGQLLSNESENLYKTLCKTPWIHWNKKNRQFLQIMLINTKDPLVISLIQKQSFNYVYNLSVMRFCYGVFTLARSL
ncbi:unnamed protein product [Phyllotreta striolata]|uniref:Odorant receptor n=1 Tax=Phyllotreta striolata TaxID=444603 RepID=A0A9N9TMW2_PHYSR|nr:unnamed protein product [Phyllotreta striolata]